jgi:phytoene/squalene synthetase
MDENGVLPLPADLLEEAGWSEGDYLQWSDNHNGSYTLIKEDLTSFVKKGIINNEQN